VRAPDLSGILLNDKPAGPTSHDVVAAVRRAVGQRRAGHGGTLDPFATGLLVVLLGRATRLSRLLTSSMKTYEGEVRFGFATDTLDCTGEPSEIPVPVRFTRAQVDAALEQLTGELLQEPPMYSAKKLGGVPLHRLARRGQTVEREPSSVTVHAWELAELEGDRLRFRVRCSAGTYVRVLAADLGRLVECPAHLAALRRTASGPFALDAATSLLGLDRERALDRLVSLDALPALVPEIRLAADDDVSAFCHGRTLALPAGEDAEGERWVRAPDGAFLGLGRAEGGTLRPVTVLSADDSLEGR
jgi:tRNA pseudouridine55 synthase